ncbi:YkuJ family protein [Ligilactobacillus ruminis]|uniref:YkuJ family protein n=1 Tax=Ligilactobacillus ruminis TaxID=1623 RepID=UPI003F983170
MENSQLVAIIKRLDAMSNNEGNEVSSRRFEKDGEERGFVTFDPVTKTYTLEEIVSKQKFEFDDIDLAAMEIYDLLND